MIIVLRYVYLICLNHSHCTVPLMKFLQYRYIHVASYMNLANKYIFIKLTSKPLILGQTNMMHTCITIKRQEHNGRCSTMITANVWCRHSIVQIIRCYNCLNIFALKAVFCIWRRMKNMLDRQVSDFVNIFVRCSAYNIIGIEQHNNSII